MGRLLQKKKHNRVDLPPLHLQWELPLQHQLIVFKKVFWHEVSWARRGLISIKKSNITSLKFADDFDGVTGMEALLSWESLLYFKQELWHKIHVRYGVMHICTICQYLHIVVLYTLQAVTQSVPFPARCFFICHGHVAWQMRTNTSH